MKSKKPFTLAASRRHPQFPKLLIRCGILSSAVLMAWSSASAQSMTSQPVARLITASTAGAPISRARRVTPETDSTASPKATTNFPNAVEQRAFDQTNSARIKDGLTPLVWDEELWRMAEAHSENMATRGFFDHETPEGLQLKDRARANGIAHFRVIAENIAYNKGFNDPGGFAVERWMISSGHRANILYVGFQASAIGSYVAADGSTYLTQVFIAR